MFLYGKSEQVQYKGKNLLKVTAKTQTVNGITFTVNEDGTVKVNGTATALTSFSLTGGSVENTFVGKKVVGCPSGGSTSGYTLAIAYYNSDKQWQTEEFETYSNSIIIKDYARMSPNIRIQSGVTVNKLIFKPMLTTDTTATYADYEPYTGGIPSPNPDYPQEIKAVVNPKVVVRGKNLLKVTAKTQTIKGVTFTVNEGGTVTVNGTATADALYILDRINIKKDVNYRLVGCPSGGANATYNMVMQDIVNWSTVFDNGSGITKSYSEDYTIIISIQIKSGVTVNNLIFKPMLSLEASATYDDYEPYTEQLAQLPYTLYAIPVSSGGNITIGGKQYVADYVDVERGKLVRNVKHKVLVGTENYNTITNWKAGAWDVANWIADGKTAQDHASISDVMSPMAIKNSAAQIAKGVIGISATKNNLFLNFGTEFTTATKIKEYIAQNNVDLYYILATPEEIDLTPEQIQAFKSLTTNYPVTNIEVSSDQLDGYIVFNYPISMAEGWNYVKQQIGDTRDYIYDMDLQSAEAYVNSEYAVALTELEVM